MHVVVSWEQRSVLPQQFLFFGLVAFKLLLSQALIRTLVREYLVTAHPEVHNVFIALSLTQFGKGNECLMTCTSRPNNGRFNLSFRHLFGGGRYDGMQPPHHLNFLWSPQTECATAQFGQPTAELIHYIDRHVFDAWPVATSEL